MKGPCCGRPWGLIALCAGVVIILALILPPAVWWFVLGAALICVGLALLCR